MVEEDAVLWYDFSNKLFSSYEGSVRDLAKTGSGLLTEAPKGQDGCISVETLRYQGSDLDGTLEMLLTEG